MEADTDIELKPVIRTSALALVAVSIVPALLYFGLQSLDVTGAGAIALGASVLIPVAMLSLLAWSDRDVL
jgi:hypothetical protein